MSDQNKDTQPQLNLNDLVFVLQVFQMASNRGAFKPEEFTAVGGCYERIFAFLESQGAVKKPEQTGETQGNQND
jgi:hypothetical protein